MSIDKRRDLQRTAETIAHIPDDARDLARRLGLNPVPVNYWLVDHDEMNQLIAYDGFQTRYPHWRWGMKYERQRQQDRHGLGRAFEIVINDDPAHAYLQESNSTADQKSVITHVEAHADFFANNRWYGLFRDEIDAAATLENHARRIQSYVDNPEIGRETVERWIDTILPLVDTIDQHRAFRGALPHEDDSDSDTERSPIDGLGLSDAVEGAVFDEEWLESYNDDPAEQPVRDVLGFLLRNGMRYDEEKDEAVEMEEWRRDVLDVLRTEAYYFAPQQMTKVTNEGWASFWQSIMMVNEAFADPDEFVEYADHQSKVLGSPGLNPYKLGLELWKHVENVANRREVATQLLCVEGIEPTTFHDVIDFDDVRDRLKPTPPLDSITEETLPDLATLGDRVDHGALDRARDGEIDITTHPWKVLTYRGLAERHFSLTRPVNRGYLESIRVDELEEIARYHTDEDAYQSIDDALAAVEYTVGWNRMREVRESHNDVTFLDEFLTPEFVRDREYFTYEYSHAKDDFRVASRDPEDVKKKLLLQFTNFGKPTIVVGDDNYRNRGELLLRHEYNGIILDLTQAKQVLERVFALWGRPVNVKTIVKDVDERERENARRRGREPTIEEQGRLLRYDGETIETDELNDEEVADIAAGSVDYRTKPDEWL